MPRPKLIPVDAMAHPEEVIDEIREYKSSRRYRPGPLDELLFSLAGHCCSLCKAPYLEVHHIEELETGGATEYDNLIVLCPNCHYRVHSTGQPTKNELRQYKRKQESEMGFPVLSRLTPEEKGYLRTLASLPPAERLLETLRFHRVVAAADDETAEKTLRREVGFVELQTSGTVSLDRDDVILRSDGASYHTSLLLRPTSKGLKLVEYLVQTERVELVLGTAVEDVVPPAQA